MSYIRMSDLAAVNEPPPSRDKELLRRIRGHLIEIHAHTRAAKREICPVIGLPRGAGRGFGRGAGGCCRGR